ncbi:MAG: hypothetical protein SOZ83_00035 [Sphaerochaetaceae bacterium]|nr:hypothetical protein [Spirochaetales bacterium]MDY3767985.1 hypothetical protein [Sphaerochaetaceae bacterium]MDY5968058.1 hypothetical protein [Sphaerochaetaceae bacterium]
MPFYRKIKSFIIHLFEETKTFALVGKSGTGKSHRAKAVAEKYYIDLIIDDGLLIKNDRILAGFSAKQEENTISAVRTAVFDTAVHRTDVINAIQEENYPRILILGTSEKMVNKIALRLRLPKPVKYIHIEDIASEDEIALAQKVRYDEGKHIIPVSAIEITRRYPNIAYRSSKSTEILASRNTVTEGEKTVVTPVFSRNKSHTYSAEDFRQIVEECIAFYDKEIKVLNFTAERVDEEYRVFIEVSLPETNDIVIDEKAEIRHIVSASLEKYANVRIESVEVAIS